MCEEDDVPRHRKKSVKKKPFGIQHSDTNFHWYLTEKARDQAFDNLLVKIESFHMIGPPKKVDR
jgi:hypothetical protein